MKVGLCDLHAVCVYVSPITLGMYIMASELISTA
jgi:hypothetical protein